MSGVAPPHHDTQCRSSLRPVEFRPLLDGQWRWAMAGCEFVTGGKAIPLQELWQQGTAK